jgi:hypothetical protein
MRKFRFDIVSIDLITAPGKIAGQSFEIDRIFEAPGLLQHGRDVRAEITHLACYEEY